MGSSGGSMTRGGAVNVAAADLPIPTGSDVLLTVLGGMGGMVVGLVVGVVPALLLGGPSFVAVGLATSVLGGMFGLWVVLVRRRGWGLRELGFVACARSAWHLLWEVPLALIAVLVLTVAAGTLLGLAPGVGEHNVISDTLTAAPWSMVIGGLAVVLFVPAVEEIVFRRVLLGWLRTRVPVGAAVLVASAAFAVVHIAPALMLYTFFLGLACALLFLWHRSLWAPFVVHAVNNIVASLVVTTALTG